MLDTPAVGGIRFFVKPPGGPAGERIVSHKGSPPPSALGRTSMLALRLSPNPQRCSLLLTRIAFGNGDML